MHNYPCHPSDISTCLRYSISDKKGCRKMRCGQPKSVCVDPHVSHFHTCSRIVLFEISSCKHYLCAGNYRKSSQQNDCEELHYDVHNNFFSVHVVMYFSDSELHVS